MPYTVNEEGNNVQYGWDKRKEEEKEQYMYHGKEERKRQRRLQKVLIGRQGQFL